LEKPPGWFVFHMNTMANKNFYVVLGLILFGSIIGCGSPEKQLSKDEVSNFKGSKDMSDEAKKHMAEGMQRMAEIRKSNGQTGVNPAPGN
jgi:hypothetical protein